MSRWGCKRTQIQAVSEVGEQGELPLITWNEPPHQTTLTAYPAGDRGPMGLVSSSRTSRAAPGGRNWTEVWFKADVQRNGCLIHFGSFILSTGCGPSVAPP